MPNLLLTSFSLGVLIQTQHFDLLKSSLRPVTGEIEASQAVSKAVGFVAATGSPWRKGPIVAFLRQRVDRRSYEIGIDQERSVGIDSRTGVVFSYDHFDRAWLSSKNLGRPNRRQLTHREIETRLRQLVKVIGPAPGALMEKPSLRGGTACTRVLTTYHGLPVIDRFVGFTLAIDAIDGVLLSMSRNNWDYPVPKPSKPAMTSGAAIRTATAVARRAEPPKGTTLGYATPEGSREPVLAWRVEWPHIQVIVDAVTGRVVKRIHFD